MNKFVLLITVMVTLFSFPAGALGCDPPSYLLFYEDAQKKLDSLNQEKSDDNLLERIILMNNLGFHDNKILRKQAEKLLKENFKRNKRTPLVVAYDGSLRMIKVKHQNKASKIFSSIFGNSPYKKARKGFNKISEALKNDPDNINIRFMRASAAVETAEYLPELLVYADKDILWLEKNIDYTDQSLYFFLILTKAKFYYKRAIKEKMELIKQDMINKAIEFILQAKELVCNEVYCREQALWEKKIFSLQDE